MRHHSLRFASSPGRATPACAGAHTVSPRWGSEERWDRSRLATRGSRRGLYDVAPLGLGGVGHGGHASQPAAHAAGCMMSPRWGGIGEARRLTPGTGGCRPRHCMSPAPDGAVSYSPACQRREWRVRHHLRFRSSPGRATPACAGAARVSPRWGSEEVGRWSRLATRGSRRGLYDVAPLGLRGVAVVVTRRNPRLTPRAL